ncbi:MAG: amidase family protein [Pseudomonadota bacterium]
MITRRQFNQSASAAAIAAATVPSTLNADAHGKFNLLLEHDGTGLAELVRSGEISPRELVETSIRAIEALDGDINALPVRDFERALDRADEIRSQGPFAGVPFAIKDTARVRGLPHATGNAFFADRISSQSDGLVRLYEASGLISLGITNTPELSLIPTTEGGVYGNCRNPWNLDHSVGGSSGGAAAAVAAGYMPLAHATDGAGSIRIPASHCGVFGLKPGTDRVLAANSNPRFAFDHVVSRTVRDSALALAVSQDRSPDIALPRMGFIQGPGKRRLTIGLVQDGYTVPTQPEVRDAIIDTARLCESLGHEVIETAQIIDQEAYEDNYRTLYAGGFLNARRAIEEATGMPIAESGLMRNFTVNFGNFMLQRTPEDVEAATAYFVAEDRRFNSWLTSFDVVLSPVMYAPSPTLGFLFDDEEDYAVTSRRVFDFLGFTSPMNVFGLPAMSVPLHMSPDGLPIGSQFAAKYGQEPMLLELAYELEAARPWRNRWAPHSTAGL